MTFEQWWVAQGWPLDSHAADAAKAAWNAAQLEEAKWWADHMGCQDDPCEIERERIAALEGKVTG